MDKQELVQYLSIIMKSIVHGTTGVNWAKEASYLILNSLDCYGNP